MVSCKQCGDVYSPTVNQKVGICLACVQANKNRRMLEANKLRMQITANKLKLVLENSPNMLWAEQVDTAKYSDTITTICETCGDIKTLTVSHVLQRGTIECLNCKKLESQSIIVQNKVTRAVEKAERKRLDLIRRQEIFKQTVLRVWGNTYGLEKTEYIRNKDKVTVTCRVHGDILIKPNDLICGHGCRKCADEHSSYSYHRYSHKPCSLYLVHIKGTELFKIGITDKSLKARFKTDYTKLDVVHIIPFNTGADAWAIENYLTRVVYKEHRYRGMPLLESGNTEIITKDVSEEFIQVAADNIYIAKEYYASGK